MKLNRKWLLVIALVLSMTMAISGTLAYLTDRDTVENVFTMGNVDIEVEEEFDQNSPLYPGVEVDKKAGIENTHETEPAYVWMVVSVPTNLAQYIELGWAGNYSATEVTSPHDGYTGYLVKYPNVLTAGSSTGNILESVKLAATVDYQNGQYVAVSGGQATVIGDLSDVKIMVDGFAIQTEGFDGVDAAYTAYTTQWGGLTGGESGTGNEPSGTAVATAEELAAALANGGEVYLTADIDLAAQQLTVATGNTVKLNLNGHDLTGAYNGDGHYAMFTIAGGGNLTVEGTGNVSATTHCTADNRSLAIFMNNGTLTLNGGNYTITDSTTGHSWIIATIVDNRTGYTANPVTAASLTINGGTYAVAGNAKNLFRNYPQAGSTATLTINGGTFKHNTAGANTYIWNQEAGTNPGYLNFLGGNFEAGVVYEDYNGQSDVTIADGVTIAPYGSNN